MVRGHQQLPLSPYLPPRHTRRPGEAIRRRRGVPVSQLDFLDVGVKSLGGVAASVLDQEQRNASVLCSDVSR